MTRIVRCCTFGLMLAIAGTWAAAGLAQDHPVFSQFYGSGVHSYYERDYFEALAALSQAIDGGTKDPRAYYYRGLSHMQLGDSTSAARDMKKGAQLESADVNQFYPVGRSLERVQGRQRVQLERYRAQARAEMRYRQMKRDAARYEQRRRAEAQVLRSVPVGPPPAPLRPAPGAVPPPTPDAPAAPAPAAAAPAEQPVAPAEESPFADPGAAPPADEQPAAEPAEANPFDTPDDAMPEDADADADNPFAPQ